MIRAEHSAQRFLLSARPTSVPTDFFWPELNTHIRPQKEKQVNICLKIERGVRVGGRLAVI